MEVNIALDTNAYSDYFRGAAATRVVIESADEIHLPFVVLAELRSGFAVGQRQAENERGLRRFLGSQDVFVDWPDDVTVSHYVDLYSYLRANGTPIPESDLWIAALTLQNNLTLCTSDAHFDYLPQIPRC